MSQPSFISPSYKTNPIKRAANNFLRIWENPIGAFVCALIIFFIFDLNHHNPFVVSNEPYFNYLADAFIHGQLNLRIIPAFPKDLSFYHGLYYLYWSPFPAILLAPLINAFGVNYSDVIFTMVVGAANAGFLACFLQAANQKGMIKLDKSQLGLLVLFFTLGTPHIYLASFGRVWFTNSVIGFFMVCLAYLAAIRLRGWKAALLTGICLGAALATRTNLIFNGIWLAWYLISDLKWRDWRTGLSRLILSGAPILAVAMGLGAYNWVRFGNLLETGYSYHLMDASLRPLFEQYGPFNLHYLATNVYYQYINYPFPLRSDTFQGGSLFLLSPLFFLAFYGIWIKRGELSTWLLVLSIFAVNIPILFLFGTGWVQFGPRYSIDFTLPLLILTAWGVSRCPFRLAGWLTVLSIFQYVIGAILIGFTL